MAPFLAGASRYPFGRFAALAVLGTGLWSAACVLLGFVFWRSFDEAIEIVQRGSLALGATAVLVLAVVASRRRRASAASGLEVRSEELG